MDDVQKGRISMRDLNDPQLLGEAIRSTMNAVGCTVVQAADYVYEDQRRNGWAFGPVNACVPLASPGLRATSAAPMSPEGEPQERAADGLSDR